MDIISDRVTRLEEKIITLTDSVKRIEKTLYGNSDPNSIIHRLTTVEADVRYIKKLLTLVISLLGTNLALLVTLISSLFR